MKTATFHIGKPLGAPKDNNSDLLTYKAPNMIKKIFILAFYILIISCNKIDSEDLLTKGIWILDNGLFSTTKETVKFYSDNTYLIESNALQ